MTVSGICPKCNEPKAVLHNNKNFERLPKLNWQYTHLCKECRNPSRIDSWHWQFKRYDAFLKRFPKLKRSRSQSAIVRMIGFESYTKYRESLLWSRIRATVLERDNHRCIACGLTEPLQIHHQNYLLTTMLGLDLSGLSTTCLNCHWLIHHNKLRCTNRVTH